MDDDEADETLVIRPVDLDDDAEFDAFYAIMRAADLHERPDAPLWSHRETRLGFAGASRTEEITGYIGYRGDEPVVAGFTLFSRLDNADIGFVRSAVAPDLRRRGFGGTMLARLVEIARTAGRTTTLTDCWVPTDARESHPYRRFVEGHGYRLANLEVHRMLELPVPEDRLRAWIDESSRHHDGYRVETFVDDVPERLLPSMCAVMNQLAVDAPTGDIEFEEESFSPEAFHENRLIAQQQGRTRCIALAIDSTDTVVAYSNLSVSEDQPEMVTQGGTLVRREHRGHRLGMAVKAANLLALQRDHPQCRRVSTCNAETNEVMVAINDTLGFQPVELLLEFQRKDALADAPVSEPRASVRA